MQNTTHWCQISIFGSFDGDQFSQSTLSDRIDSNKSKTNKYKKTHSFKTNIIKGIKIIKVDNYNRQSATYRFFAIDLICPALSSINILA